MFRRKKWVPVVRQVETAECGLACLAMILRHHGRGTELDELRRAFGGSMRGLSIEGLASLAARFRLVPNPVRVELDELRQLRAPCILHWAFTHFVVLVDVHAGVGATHAIVNDPAVGRRRLSWEELSSGFTGVALEFVPAEDFERRPPARRFPVIRQFWASPGVRTAVVQLAAVSLGVELLAMAAPLLQQWVVDGVVATGDADLLTTLALAFALVATLKLAIGLLRDWAALRFMHLANERWILGTLSHLMRLPCRYFEARPLGEVLAGFASAKTISQTVSALVFVTAADLILMGLSLGLMLVYSAGLSACVIAGCALQVALKGLANLAVSDAENQRAAEEGREQAHVVESVRGIRAIKAANREEDRRGHWLRLFSRAHAQRYRSERINAAVEGAKGYLTALELILVLFLGAKAVLAQQLTVGALFAFTMYRGHFAARSMKALEALLRMSQLKAHAARMQDVVDQAPEHAAGSRPGGADGLPATIEFRDVGFRPSAESGWVIRHCSFRVEAGEHVAITGESGCGKSTLMRLLLGFAQPTEGEILVGGEPLARLGLHEVRRMCASVQQDDVLFAGTVAENIAFHSPDAQREHIESAARSAAVHAAIQRFPLGYDSFVGDMGQSLSGGERQRLLLARAFYRKTPILLLDEATSHLDAMHEAQVMRAIGGMGRTCLSIAHRRQTLAKADRVLVLGRGGLVACGDLSRLNSLDGES